MSQPVETEAFFKRVQVRVLDARDANALRANTSQAPNIYTACPMMMTQATQAYPRR
jgi:hypothetical protein